MGRGRAKAKQAKVARQLKYNTPEMDLERLQRELAGGSDRDQQADEYNDEYSDEPWSEYIDDDEDEPQR
ncbi:DUF3073 domain-containing protein [Corynebacterium sp. 320]|uniref:DUF3073 domain-containing protein n=1 Tax=Corynebacterium zhongnanshanii TaxID=2768834 RepID=A0ABQ6VC25_9CORY|nr:MULTISPECIES: DUF3073 domain-containing protein [Corynebacterium]KAB1503001.1 DUF3073 domain-containing protein [Corynebacterium sp. 320]KAB1550788.1 DUF3073 domain-containing protein [Corynebacterium sp. 321]KAB1551145.1 DUF3073 domain-containing protein [Corynebacterium sp. 319]KAB3519797.1 DUF3073 domain-containing protein [Corynebacterium zhongnanshanii]KAB3526798.1 DUF3073 domain-containing protein [Corynebacterium sp. 250]